MQKLTSHSLKQNKTLRYDLCLLSDFIGAISRYLRVSTLTLENIYVITYTYICVYANDFKSLAFFSFLPKVQLYAVNNEHL